MAVARNTQLHDKHEDRYAVVVEKHTLVGATAITLMNHISVWH